MSCLFMLPEPGTGRVLGRRVPGGATPISGEIEGGGWVPPMVQPIGAAATSVLGVGVRVARHVASGTLVEVCEVELLDAASVIDETAFAWSAPEELIGWPVDEEHRAYILERLAATDHPARSPWERPGWLTLVTPWIDARLAEAGHERTSAIAEVKSAWPHSAVLTMETTSRRAYFKAVSAKPPAEPRVIQALASISADIPDVVAVDDTGRWMLQWEIEGEEPADLAAKSEVVRRMAVLQRAAVGARPRLVAAGCPEMRAADLARDLETLVDCATDAAKTWGDTPEVATYRSNIEAVGEAEPTLQALCRALARSPLPDTVVHEDFRVGNMLVGHSGPVFFDWSDTVVAHPFFSFSRLMDAERDWTERESVDFAGPTDADRRRLADVHLAAWSVVPGDHARDLRLVRLLNPLFLANRWHFEIAYIEPGCPWHEMIRSAVAGELMRLGELLTDERDLIAELT